MSKPTIALGRVRRVVGRLLVVAGATGAVAFAGSTSYNAGWSNGRLTLYPQNGCAILVSFPPELGDTSRNGRHNPYISRNVIEPIRWFYFKLHRPVPATVLIYETALPLWTVPLVTIPTGIALMVSGSRPLHWLRQGRCARCGYDLKGGGAATICPECGGAGG
ncbi:MAG: hypothetical protein K2Q09_12290 [Phycisphaerales bacterium]|nr:hypothetical protein [Phycisphaerales bacterium]